MSKASLILSAVLMAVLAVSCEKKQLDTTYDKQEGYILAISESLGNAADSATIDHLKGTVLVTVAHGQGETLGEDGAVAFYYAGYYISGNSLSSSNVFATNNESFANSINWSLSDSTSFDIMTVNLAQDDIVEGLRNGLVGVKGGDECYVLFDGRYGFGKRKVANVPGRSALAYHLWIRSISNN